MVIFDPINLRLLRLSHSDRHLRPSNAPNQLIQRGFRNPSAKSGSELSVRVTAMGDSKGEDHEICIFDRVDDPVVTYAYAPQV